MNFESTKVEVLVVALHQLNGDRLAICMGADGERPKAISAPKARDARRPSTNARRTDRRQRLRLLLLGVLAAVDVLEHFLLLHGEQRFQHLLSPGPELLFHLGRLGPKLLLILVDALLRVVAETETAPVCWARAARGGGWLNSPPASRVTTSRAVAWSTPIKRAAVRQSRKKSPAPALRCNSPQSAARRIIGSWAEPYRSMTTCGGACVMPLWQAAWTIPSPMGALTLAHARTKSAHDWGKSLVLMVGKARQCHSWTTARTWMALSMSCNTEGEDT